MAPKKKKVTPEERKIQKRNAERLRYARLKSDPVKAEELQMKNKEKRKKRKEEGKDKPISDMTEREQRRRRKNWRQNSRNYRQKKKIEKQSMERERSVEPENDWNNLDIAGPSSFPVQSVAHQITSGEKRRRIHRRQLQAKNMKLQDKITRLKKTVERIRMRLRRERQKPNKKRLTDFKSPNTKVNHILELNDPKVVRKKLLFGESLVKQLEDNWKRTKSPSAKRGFSKAIIGHAKWLKRYGLMGEVNFIPSKCLRNDIRSRRLNNSCKGLRARKLTESVRSDVRTFLEEEDHSRVCPGKKDCITRGKVKKQKRMLQAHMKDLHKSFLETHPYEISYASFCRLKPFWILTPNVAQRDTCLCIIHDNFRLLLLGLLSNAKAIANPNPAVIKRQLCCSPITESCLFRTCKKCCDNNIMYNLFDGAMEVNYDRWMRIKVEFIDPKTKAKKTIDRMAKQTIQKPILDLVRKADEDCQTFLSHEGKVFHQHAAIKKLKASLRPGEFLIHCDFSENYATKYHSEIQSIHFGGNRLNLSLHTVIVYYRTENLDPVSLANFCTISENLDHCPSAIWAHFTPIFEFLHALKTPITKIHFLSDGPSSQYRNKSLFFLFQHKLHESFGDLKEATWNYHEAGHGKGAPDGIGATVKRTADQTVAHGKDVVNLETFHTVLRNSIRNIKIHIIDSSVIETMALLIPQSLKPFKGTMEVHQIVWQRGKSEICMNKLSCFTCSYWCKFHMIGTHQQSASLSIILKQPAKVVNKRKPKTRNLVNLTSMLDGNNHSYEHPALPSDMCETAVAVVSNSIEFPSQMLGQLEKEMQDINGNHIDLKDEVKIESGTLDASNEESEKVQKKTKNVTEGLCFKCGGALSSKKIGVVCDICRRIAYHEKCARSFNNDFMEEIDIFCCEQCDVIARQMS